MRALAADPGTGRSSVVDAPVPTPGPGQILAQVRVSAVNEMDVQVRAGGWARQVKHFARQGRVLTGFEFAGVAWSDGRRARAGQRIIAYSPVLDGPRTHAEFVAIDERFVQTIPDDLADDAAAALAVMGLTAVEVLERIAPLTGGQRCLVIGAAGGVGAYAVQLAASRGVRVTGVCSAASADWVLAQGAAEVRPYEGAAPYRPGDPFDLVVDTPAASSFREAAPRLSRRGIYVSTNPTADGAGFLRAALSSRRAGYLMMLRTDPARLSRLIALAGSGALRPVVDSIYDLVDADAAFDRFATRGKQGRVLLRIAAALSHRRFA